MIFSGSFMSQIFISVILLFLRSLLNQWEFQLDVQFVFMGSGQTPGLNMALEYFEEELKVIASFFCQSIFVPHPACNTYIIISICDWKTEKNLASYF